MLDHERIGCAGMIVQRRASEKANYLFLIGVAVAIAIVHIDLTRPTGGRAFGAGGFFIPIR
jgi:hypothetical protein